MTSTMKIFIWLDHLGGFFVCAVEFRNQNCIWLVGIIMLSAAKRLSQLLATVGGVGENWALYIKGLVGQVVTSLADKTPGPVCRKKE